MDYIVRPMALEDLTQVTEIEQESFPHPWSEDYFRQELTVNQVARYLVVHQGAIVLGYIGIWLIVGEIHITTIAIRKSHRRRGLGERLLIAAIELAMEHQSRLITLEVRESNSEARGLYRKYGFTEAGLRQQYYTETGEDAIIMSTKDINSPSFQCKFQHLKQINAEV